MPEKIKNFSENSAFLINENVLAKLSPLQKKIVTELTSGPLTLNELSNRVDSSVFTVGKQLSMLQCRTKCKCLQKKGIQNPLVQKNKDEKIKTTYFLV